MLLTNPTFKGSMVTQRPMRARLSLLVFLLFLAASLLPVSQVYADLSVTVSRAHKTEARTQPSYTSRVTGGTPPYHFIWTVFDPSGQVLMDVEKKDMKYVEDLDVNLPDKTGRYTIKLFVRDKWGSTATARQFVTIGKAAGSSGPAISDLSPIIHGPNYVEAGQEFQITWDAQGSGVGKVEWEWQTPKGTLKNKGLKGKLAAPDRELTVTLLAWDQVSPKGAIKMSHVVRSVKPLDVTITTSGVKRLGPREFQVEKGKPFQLVAKPFGGVGKTYKVKWGNRAESPNYGGTLNKTGSGKIRLAVQDQGRWQTTPKTWDLTIKSVEKASPAATGGISGWWLYLREREETDGKGKKRKVVDRIPVIINPQNDDDTYSGAYFPELSTTRTLVYDKDTLIAKLKLYPRGGAYYYRYSYNDRRDKGDGTMSGGGNALSGPWKSTEGNGSGDWTWVRPNVEELKKLRKHFGRG